MKSEACPEVVLLQLPFTELAFRKHWGNVPLAAGLLKALAVDRGVVREDRCEILGPEIADLCADARLIDAIVARNPRVLGFSLFYYNSQRSLFIAEEVKKRLPETVVIVGGPEVKPDVGYLTTHPVIDAGCIGEGEGTFVEFLNAVLMNREWRNIQGLFHRFNGRMVMNPEHAPIADLDAVPSPYVKGFLDPRKQGAALLETQRGCPFKCSYCSWRNRPRASASAARVLNEIRCVLERGNRRFQMCDSNFLSSPVFQEVCDGTAELSSMEKPGFFCYVSAGQVDPTAAHSLRRLNCTLANVGLQSANLRTLAGLHRKPDLEAFVRGCGLLNDHGIHCEIDIISGLPEDSLDDFKKTLDFIAANGLNNDLNTVTLFRLWFMPGIPLRQQTARYGMVYDPAPPYYLQRADYISEEELEQASILATGRPRPLFNDTLTCGFHPSVRHRCDRAAGPIPRALLEDHAPGKAVFWPWINGAHPNGKCDRWAPA